MVSEIRIYVEGGGDGKETKARFREGMTHFLSALKSLAREKSIRWDIVACGSRNDTLRNFRSALKSHPQAFNVLLVDSEAPFTATSPTVHLKNRDGWDMAGMADEQCHLMVEMMENWFLADVDALESFYKKGFNRNAIPRNQNVEQIAKADVETALKNAIRGTIAGRYQKIRHGTQLLEKVNPELVRKRAPNCERIFKTLECKLKPKEQNTEPV